MRGKRSWAEPGGGRPPAHPAELPEPRDQGTPPDTPPGPRVAPALPTLLPEAGPAPPRQRPSAETPRPIQNAAGLPMNVGFSP